MKAIKFAELKCDMKDEETKKLCSGAKIMCSVAKNLGFDEKACVEVTKNFLEGLELSKIPDSKGSKLANEFKKKLENVMSGDALNKGWIAMLNWMRSQSE